MYTVICLHCGESFTARKPHAKFCPDKPCKNLYHRSRPQPEQLNDLFSKIVQVFDDTGMSSEVMIERIVSRKNKTPDTSTMPGAELETEKLNSADNISTQLQAAPISVGSGHDK
ncbi:MAG: hypothetical protein HY356_07820 [Gammaproteobacteria bacterium]|nr:hypothetical protein [Gammaproteobacteria bacterium]